MSSAFPFTAIVGQDELREALLINVVRADVGGLLVCGARGTAKSTAVRALLPLLPPVRAAVDAPFAFAPGDVSPAGQIVGDADVELRAPQIVDVPLATTLDRLVGALDLGRALAGERSFEAGLVARAHRGVLYVDEVNLLPDHLVDSLLDVAASGVAVVERDAVSVRHDARFLLIGTMNVEEGDLRPQLLDRFGLSVTVESPADPATRAEIVRRRLAFERNPEGFCAQFADEEAALAEQLEHARQRAHRVHLPERELQRITGACAQLGIDGARGDITCSVAAMALAALEGEGEVRREHVERAARYALAHRMRRDPLAKAGEQPDLKAALDDGDPRDGDSHERDRHGRDPSDDDLHERDPHERDPRGGDPRGGGSRYGEPRERPDADAPAPRRRPQPVATALPTAALAVAGSGSGPSGRRARSAGPASGAIDSCAKGDDDELAVVPSLVATIASGRYEQRAAVRAGREGVLLCFVVDASGSMSSRRRAARVKGALLQMLRDAYARRDKVMVVVFRGSGAELLVKPGTPLERAAAAVHDMETGGRSPLAAGLQMAAEYVTAAARRDRDRRVIAVLVTDGRATDRADDAHDAARALARAADAFHVVDTDDGPVRVGISAALANAAGGLLHVLEPIGGHA